MIPTRTTPTTGANPVSPGVTRQGPTQAVPAGLSANQIRQTSSPTPPPLPVQRVSEVRMPSAIPSEFPKDSGMPAYKQNDVMDANKLRGVPEKPLTGDQVSVDEIPASDAPVATIPKPADDADTAFALPAEAAEAAIVPPANAPDEAPKKGRDYTAFTPEQVDVLKKLPNGAYQKATKLFAEANEAVKERDELKTSAAGPRMFHEHPQAFVLDPGFQEAQALSSQADAEYAHYSRQLVAIKSGKPWYKMGYDAKTGEPRYTKVEAPEDGTVDVESEIQCGQALGLIARAKEGSQAKVLQLVSAHANQRQQVDAAISAIDSKIFSKVQVDKFNPTELKIYTDAMAMIPQFKHHPTQPLFGKAAVVVHRLVKQIGVLEAAAAKNSKIKTITKDAGTTPVAGGPSVSGKVNGIDLNTQVSLE